MFTAALFTIVKICKQLKYPTTNKWIKILFSSKTKVCFSWGKGPYPNSPQGLHLSLCSQGPPGDARRQYAVPGIKLGSDTCKEVLNPCTISLVPKFIFFYNLDGNGGHHVKQNKLEGKGQMSNNLSHIMVHRETKKRECTLSNKKQTLRL